MKIKQREGLLRYRRYACAGLLSVLTLLVCARTGQAAVIADGLSELVREALANNREIQSLEEKARALRAEAPFAGSLKDPTIGLAILNLPLDTFRFDQEPMTQKQITIGQQIPWFGKLNLAEQGAELMAVEQEAMVKALRLKITRQVKEAWYELGFIERSLEVNAKLREVVTQMLRIAESRYATGDGLQQDVLLAQVQLSELMDKDVALKAGRRKLQDTIGSLLNRDEPLRNADDHPPFPELAGLERQRLTDMALRENPLVEARRTAVLKAEVDVQLAEKEYLPDMDFKVSYGQRENDPVSGDDRADFISAGVTFTVPLWQNTRQDSKLAGSRKRLLSARRSLQSLEKTLPHQIDGLLSEIEGAQESKRLFTDALTVQTSQLADSSLAAYSVGKVEFNTMLSTHIRQLQVELQAERYGSLANKKLAELEETVGQPIAAQKEK